MDLHHSFSNTEDLVEPVFMIHLPNLVRATVHHLL